MIKLNIFLLIGIISVLIVMSACKSINETDLYGTYVAKYSFGTEKLILNAGGEYIQEVFIKDDTKSKPSHLTRSGRWRYESSDKYVELEHALAVADPAAGLKKDYDVPFDGIVLRKVRRVFPSIRLGTAYEDIAFEKVGNQ